jgi:hypothetical protein
MRWLLHPGERTANILWIGGWVDPRISLDAAEMKKNLLPLLAIESEFLSHPARSPLL